MRFTNYGNKYKFKAIMARRSSNVETVTMQRLRKDGTWGKPTEERVYGSETPQDVLKRLTELNPTMTFRLVEKPETTEEMPSSRSIEKADSDENKGKADKGSENTKEDSTMQINYNVTGTQRKEMVEVISTVVKMQPVYKFMPTCAYAISNITVDKGGVMSWDKRTDDATIKAVKAALAKAGFKPVATKTENNKQPVRTAAAAITPAKTSKTVSVDKAAKAPAKKSEEEKVEKPRQGYAGKTGWGADWTFNPANNLFIVASEDAGKGVRLSNIGDIFSDDLPLSLEQRKEVYALMDGSQKFAALMRETENALLQIRNRIENFGAEQFRSSAGEQYKLTARMAAKVEMLRCELNSL